MNHKILLTAFLIAVAFPGTAFSTKASEKCELIQCQGLNCGCDLKNNGWKEIARCQGHKWTYIIELNGQRKICRGINSRSGPTENPCLEFEGDLKDFQLCQEKKFNTKIVSPSSR